MFDLLGRLPGGGTRRPWAGWRRERPAAPGEPTDFAGWARRFGLTEADLRRLHRRHAARCALLAGGALFALAFGATAAFAAFAAFGGGPALLAVLLALLFLAGAAGHSLRAWQLRERRLGSFGEWASRPGAWVPSFFSEAK